MQPKSTNGPLARAECKAIFESRQCEISNSEYESQRINPASIDSERAILGAIMEDDDIVMPGVVASCLRSADFFLSEHRRIFDVASRLWQESKHIDLLLVTERLGSRPEDAVIVASCIHGVIVHPDHISDHIEIVRNKARLRALLQVAEWVSRVVDDSADSDALIEEAIQRLERIARQEVKA